MDLDLASFTAPHPIPVRTGHDHRRVRADGGRRAEDPRPLTVIPLENWDRGRWFDQTGLPWVNPSPNIRSLTQALLYSGIGLLEATNLSVGRGTDMPFEVIGAPWIEPQDLAAALNDQRLPGVGSSRASSRRPRRLRSEQRAAACGFVVTDREAIRPVTVGPRARPRR